MSRLVESELLLEDCAISALRSGAAIRAWNTIFRWPIKFRNVSMMGEVYFASCLFESVEFMPVQLPHRLTILDSAFTGQTLWLGSQSLDFQCLSSYFFGNNAFDGSSFGNRVVLRDVQFRGSLSFDGATFHSDFELIAGRFHNSAFFRRARFEDRASIINNEVAGGAEFTGSKFAAELAYVQ